TPGQPLYNVYFGEQITGSFDIELLRRCLAVLVQRHESLRTTFPELAIPPGAIPTPRALIAPDGPTPLDVVDLAQAEDKQASLARYAAEHRARPFDLQRGPLWRSLIVRLDDDHHAFLLTQHHIITDGASADVLLRELSELYRSRGDVGAL